MPTKALAIRVLLLRLSTPWSADCLYTLMPCHMVLQVSSPVRVQLFITKLPPGFTTIIPRGPKLMRRFCISTLAPVGMAIVPFTYTLLVLVFMLPKGLVALFHVCRLAMMGAV